MRIVPRSRIRGFYLALQRRFSSTITCQDSLEDALNRASYVKRTVPSIPTTSPVAAAADDRRRVWYDLLSAFAGKGMIAESMATLDDVRACQEPMDVKMLDLTLKAAIKAKNDARINEVLQAFKFVPKYGDTKHLPTAILPHESVCRWSPTTISLLLEHCAHTQNLEYMLLLIMSADTYGLLLDDKSLSSIIQCCSDAREPRLAWDIVQKMDQIRQLPPFIWMRVLRACAQHDFGPALCQAWDRSVMDGGLEPDYGLVTQVLSTASRAGLDTLVDRILQSVKEPDEMVFVPAMDAYIEASRYKDVFDILSQMKECQIPLQPAILAHLTSMVSSDKTTLHSACSALLQNSKPVSPEVWNALIYAAANLKDVLMSNKLTESMPVPTTDTYQAWLLCCINAQDLTSGKLAWKALEQNAVRPSSICYERMIRLYLAQPIYEEAFQLLEEAKQLHLVPTRRTYASMIWTCWQWKDERWIQLLKEMREANYEPSGRFRDMLNINTTTTTPVA